MRRVILSGGGTPNDVSLTEDTEGRVFSADQYNFIDPDNSALTATVTASSGTFTTVLDGSSVGATESLNADKDVLTVTGTAAAITDYLNATSNYLYTPQPNLNGSDAASIVYRLSDGTSNPIVREISVSINSVNDAPVLDTSSPRSESISENAGDDDGTGTDGDDDETDNSNNDGRDYTGLFASGAITDVDVETDGVFLRAGLAIVEIDDRNGEWQYQTDHNYRLPPVGPREWQRLATGADSTLKTEITSSRLISPRTGYDVNIRFLPNENFVGSATIKFRAWQHSFDEGVKTGNTSIVGGSSNYSSEVGTYTVNVLDVKYPPVITNLDGESKIYYNSSAPIAVDDSADATVTDRDPTSYNGGSLSIRVSDNAEITEDLLSFDVSGDVALAGLTAGSSVSVEGTVVGTLANNIAEGNDLVVNFNSSASAATAQALLRAATYTNTDTTTPTQSTRTLQVMVSDGDTGVSETAELTVRVDASNNDATLSAASGVAEPIVLPTTADIEAEAVAVFDFTITDGGGGDGEATVISSVAIDISGTTNDLRRGKTSWLLSGPGLSGQTGSYNSASDTVRFNSLPISIADGASATFTVSAYYNDASNIIDNQTIVMSLGGAGRFSGSGTQVNTASILSGGSGTLTTVTATQLAFTRQPAGSTSGSALSTQPWVAGVDEHGNTDTDFAETLILVTPSAGAISGDLDVAAVAGVAKFTDIVYSATADGESFLLTANDQDGVGADFGTVDSDSVSSNVVASKLIFLQEPTTVDPTPRKVISGLAGQLDPDAPMVVAAVDAADVIDTDYGGSIQLSEINGAGSVFINLRTVSGSSPSKTASSGTMSAGTSASITYNNAGATAETFNLQASASGLTSAVSAQFTSVIRDSTAQLTSASAISEPVSFPTSAVSLGSAVPILDFTISDGGGLASDTLATKVSRLLVRASGTSTDAERGQVELVLSGPGISPVSFPYFAANDAWDTQAVADLGIVVADGASAVYTLSAYFTSAPLIAAGATLTLSIDGDDDVVDKTSGTVFRDVPGVSTELFGSSLTITGSRLAFVRQPAGITSGAVFSTQPQVAFVDSGGNIDTGFTELITLTASGAGTLSGDLDVAAAAGVATFTDLTYTATADGESFSLTANDEDGVATDLSTVSSSTVTADVVATRLVFATEPAPLAGINAQPLWFTTPPVLQALDADGLLDTDFTAAIGLGATGGAGTARIAVTGDTDADDATASLNAVAGVATFSALSATYTHASEATETYALRASSAGLSSADSAVISSLYPDGDGSLTAASGVTEPVAIDTTRDSLGEAVDIFDFVLSDGGGADGMGMAVSTVRIHVSGTSSDALRAQLTWLLSGPGVSAAIGTYDAGSDSINFTGLGIDLASGGSGTYTLSAFFNDNSSVSEGATLILAVDGDSDLTFAGSTIGSSSPVSNGTGSRVSVEASTLVFATAPAGTTAGLTFTTQPVVTAQDAFGNTDIDFSETITLSESSAGTLGGDIDVAAVAGTATFSGLSHKPAADGETVVLTADDEGDLTVGTRTDLPPVSAPAITSNVIATTLGFVAEPAPLNLVTARATELTVVPTVGAVNADGVVDVDYTGTVTLTEINGAGSALMTVTGDSDADPATATLALSAGAARFADMSLTYTNSGAENETFNLQASLAGGALSSATSAEMRGVVADTDANLTSASGVAEPVNLATTVTAADAAVDVFDFTLSDGASVDSLELLVNALSIQVGGTTTDAQRAKLEWRLRGPDLALTDAEASGTYNAVNDEIDFAGLSLAIPSGGSEVYTLSAYFNDSTGITDNGSLTLSLDGARNLTVDGAGTQFGATTAIDNLGGGATGTQLTVSATQLSFAVDPADSVSGSVLTTQPVVHALDASANLDTDFTETLSLTPQPVSGTLGSLAGDTDVAAVAGVARFSDVAYTAGVDKQRTVLRVDDESAVGTDLATATSAPFSAEVVATAIGFIQQPSPLSVFSGDTVTFIPPIKVGAQGAGGVTDIDATGAVVLREINGPGTVLLDLDADTDSSENTVTMSLVAGEAEFTDLRLRYLASSLSDESFNLEAALIGLTAGISDAMSSTEPPPPGDKTIRDKVDGRGKTVVDLDIAEGGEYSGGTVCGTVSSRGILRDVTLCPGAIIDGGSIAGDIIGDPEEPATLVEATILPGTRLENVRVGADVILLKGVIIGENVGFDSLINVPAGVMLTETLEKIAVPGAAAGDERVAIDLRSKPLPGAAASPRTSYLELVGEAPEFSSETSSLEQAPSGEVLMEFPDSESRLLPVAMRKTQESDHGFFLDDDGNLTIRMGISLEIIMYPMFSNEPAVLAATAAYDSRFSLTYDNASNFVFTRDTKQGIDATEPRYVGRPGISAFKAVRSRSLGFHFYPSPWLKNLEQVSIISENSEGIIMEQELVPVPRDWLALKARLLAEPGVSSARIDSYGVISVVYRGQVVRLLASYESLPNKAPASDNRGIVFVAAGDLNGDGEVDYYSYYPNGERQTIYVFP